MSSEDYLEQVSKFDFESIVEIVRKVKEEGIPKQFENVSEQIYILSYLWAKRSVILSNALAIKIEEVAKEYGIGATAKLPINPVFAQLADKGMIEEFSGDYLNKLIEEITK